ncbi:hypothetical protein SASPL_145941 [Salvia splendens]|uniref:ABC-2 type transporter domain-containing protein n=1 Tax=Salvia splendens TaxID=180675 RepID=A0A8X8WJ12_SALSN|nr:hypothetical protein SASPL_145941 [Salvia splendens]
MSIHQPSYRILGLLDQMIFLSRGQTVYSGSPSNLPVFFSDFKHPIPEEENRPEFTLDIIRELEGSPGGTKALVEFNKTWHALKRENDASRHSQANPMWTGAAAPASLVPTFANPIWIEMAVLSKRSITNSRRMPELFSVRLGAVMVTGFILATVFWRLDTSPKGVQERVGFFAFAMSTMFYTCADALPVFLHERYIFMRETAYNACRRSSYVISHAAVSLPSLMFLSLAFTATTFWAVGLDWSFMFYLVIIFASFWAGSSFVTFLSGVVQIFDNTPLAAVPEELKGKLLESLSSSLGIKITRNTCVTTGADILLQQGVTDLTKMGCLWVTIAWGFFFKILFYLSLLVRSKNKRA